MGQKETDAGSLATGISIVEVRVRNFRSLKSVDIPLGQITILIGENNSGKSSFLEAMHAAIGGVRRGLTKDDIYTTPDETTVPKDRYIIVDLLIKPTDKKGNIIDAFPAGGFWTMLFGNGIKQDDSDKDFAAIRTVLQWDRYEADYRVERGFLKEWLNDSVKIENASIDPSARVSQALEPLSLFFMDAKRDIEDDMRRQKSVWGKLTSDLGLPDELVKKIERSLSDLNSEMIDNSEVLSHLMSDLQVLNNLVAGEDEGVKISPIARAIRDLTKGIGLDFTTKGSQTFPLTRHGMGTKSLASVLVFKSFVSWRIKKAMSDKIHPTLALEEPEAHLHPQAQRALVTQISGIPGQVIVSTHSPYVAAQSSIQNLRHFSKTCSDTTVSVINVDNLDPHEIEKINRFVMNTRGEVLFSRAFILFEGPTEEYALPIFANKFWGKNAHMCGISFIGVGGDGNYLPFLQMAQMCHIPWYIFADGEPDPVVKLKAQLNKIGISDISKAQNIIVIPNNDNFEKYLVSEKYEDAICIMLDKHNGVTDFISIYIKQMHGQKSKGSITRDYQSSGGRERALVDALLVRKVGYAQLLAEIIVGLENQDRRFPPLIKDLLGRVSADFGFSKVQGEK